MILVFTRQTAIPADSNSKVEDCFRSISESKVSAMMVDSGANISGTVRILEVKAAKYLKLIPETG